MADEKDKPGFDEQTLGRLLEAAFVLQEHSAELKQIRADLERKAKQPATPAAAEVRASANVSENDQKQRTHSAPSHNGDYSSTLAQIVDLQRRIQSQRLTPTQAMSLVAEQVTDICGSAGAAVGLVSAKSLSYRAVAGIRTLPVGSTIPLQKALCFPAIRTGQAFSCADTKPELLIDSEECRRRGIGSLIAVPIFRDHGITGGLEVYWSDAAAFTDEDVHTCQLLAALLTEALSGKDAVTEPAEVAARRTAAPQGSIARSIPPSTSVAEQPASPNLEDRTAPCYKCGHPLLTEEQFCGECGASRSSENGPPSLQSKVASLWHKQEIEKKESVAKGTVSNPATKQPPPKPSAGDQLTAAMVPVSKPPMEPEAAAPESAEVSNSGTEEPSPGVDSANSKSENIAQAATPEAGRSADWTSALSAREFLEQFAAGNRKNALLHFWNARRGDVYLAIALLLVTGVIGWGIRSNRAVKPTAPPKANPPAVHKQPPAPELPLFDRMLISLGLAEAPQPPEYKGTPSIQVWEDLRTGLYYCPGTDMYGKTQKGKYTSQRDAQLDRFEPAYRKACD